ncbi:hypothetical protein HYY72_03170 [Candidatus Woesearchaeota archaeon]|nr:hypothetical protein [Candidatus Woesearchaeota archaeon]
MLKESEYESIRSELVSKNPLFLMHDDPDGLSSFLLLYRHCRKGNGVLVKTNPLVDSKYLGKVDEYSPDKVFIVDIAVVEQEFIDRSGVPVIWIDHHEPLKRSNVLYFNPRIHRKDAYYPATYLCYKAVRQDLWIAMVGCVGDWFLPEFSGEFSSKYPDLLDEKISNADDAMFMSKLGTLVRVFSFVLKGRTSDAMKCVKILTRVKSPYDILNQETAGGRFLFRRYEKFNSQYQGLLADASSKIGKGMFFSFIYDSQTSFSSDLANELLYMHPDKFIIIGREKYGEIKMSLRSRRTTVLPKLKNALVGIDGYGGGHEYACGASVRKSDFERFAENLRRQL